jgi:hypothetical protein
MAPKSINRPDRHNKLSALMPCAALMIFKTARLDRPWKRVAFILWVPLFLATAVVSAYAILCIYFLNLYDDVDLWFCHRDIAGFAHRPGDLDPQDMRAMALAHERLDSRFSAETRKVEASPEFIKCMSENRNGSYWTNYSFTLRAAAKFLLLTGFFALLIFPRFWRSIGGWIGMKSG